MFWMLFGLVGLLMAYRFWWIKNCTKVNQDPVKIGLSVLAGGSLAFASIMFALTAVNVWFSSHPAVCFALRTDVEKRPSVVIYQLVDPPQSVVSTSSSHGTIYDLPTGLLKEEAVVVEGQRGFYTLETLPDGTREYKEKMYRADLVRILEDAQRAQTADEHWRITETTESRDLGNYRWLWWPLKTFQKTTTTTELEKVIIYEAPVETSVGPADN